MSNVVPFVPRAAGGDWTAGERERLTELAGKLQAEGAHVDAAYGVSDAGDPWCVITDADDEVLIHVARIDGQFVIHDAAADAIEEDDTLWSAFERLMGPGWRDGRDDNDMVVPLRQAQSVLALVAAMLFVREFLHADGQADAPAPAEAGHGAALAQAGAALAIATHDVQAAQPAVHTPAPEDSSPRRQALVARSAETASESPADTTLAHAEAPAPAATSAPAIAAPLQPMTLAQASIPATGQAMHGGDGGQTLHGGAGDDLIVGGRGGDHLIGGGGDDTLIGRGAGPGQVDLLEGGAGNDRIYLAERTVAIGGEGHDTFVLPDPPKPEAAQAKAGDGAATPSTATQTTPVTGVVLDFTTDDRLVFGQTGKVVSVTTVVDVLDGYHGFATLARQPATPGVQVGIDYDGDGSADTYVLIAGTGATSIKVGMTSSAPALDPHQAEPIGITGASSSTSGDLTF